MNANPMTEQVARLVGNLLAGGETLGLPGIGSLRVERRPARRIDRRHVVPPCRTVQFSSQEDGVSLVEEIARALRVNGAKPDDPMPEARKVYDRWIAQVREGETLTIVGVGVLRFKDFKLDEVFDHRLNPQGHEPVRIPTPRRFDAVLWIGIAAVVCVVGFTAWWWFSERGMRREMRSVVTERLAETNRGAVQPVADSTAVTDSLAATVRENSVAAEHPEAESVADAPQASAPTLRNGADPASGTGPTSLVSGRNYVVMGVFSTEENARRAARESSTREVAIACSIYRFGAKFMVSPFESDDAEACRLFIRAHEERFPGMWTYTAR